MTASSSSRIAPAVDRSGSMNWTAEFAASAHYSDNEKAELESYIDMPMLEDEEAERRAMEASLTMMTLGMQGYEPEISASDAEAVLEVFREEAVAGDEGIEDDLPLFPIARRGESVAGEPELQDYWDGMW
jgi:hypothetical protein